MTEFVFAGLLITPLVKAALIALAIYLPVRMVFVRLPPQKVFWHPLLAEAAIYVCIVAMVNFVMP